MLELYSRSYCDHNHTYIGRICLICFVKNGPFIIREDEKHKGFKIKVKKRKIEKIKQDKERK